MFSIRVHNSNQSFRQLFAYAGKRWLHRSIGIVGLPNVGKSTLFNALTKTQQAQAANYPFCTIDPNTARVAVPDPRVRFLGQLENSEKVVETQLEFVDIAGLVRGASKGEGLGNKFLENIRQVAVIAHVVRCFEDSDVIHVDSSVDPLRDLETIRTELILADLQVVEKKIDNLERKKRAMDDTFTLSKNVLLRVKDCLEDNRLLNQLVFISIEERAYFQQLQLLSAKKMLYLCNVSESDAATGNEMTRAVADHIAAEESICATISATLEEEAASFGDDSGQLEYLQACGLDKTGLTRIIQASQDVLQLHTFYTVGKKEARAWSIMRGSSAAVAASVIHSDFEKLFIRAEVISYDDFVQAGDMKNARKQGLLRIEGRDYVCKDGDICNFLVGK